MVDTHFESLNMLKVVSIPAFDGLVFASREEHVCVREKSNGHDTIIVSKDGLVTVTKIQTPYPDVFVN